MADHILVLFNSDIFYFTPLWNLDLWVKQHSFTGGNKKVIREEVWIEQYSF